MFVGEGRGTCGAEGMGLSVYDWKRMDDEGGGGRGKIEEKYIVLFVVVHVLKAVLVSGLAVVSVSPGVDTMGCLQALHITC